MMKSRIAAIAALVSVTACEGLKEAMTAHVDVVARAEKQELSVQRVADLLGPTQFPLGKPLIEQVAQTWVNYQLLAKAASVGDSLVDVALIDKVMWPVYAQSKTTRWVQQVTARLVVDTSNLESAYNAGTHFLAARHILFQVPKEQAATGSDSIMRRAEAIKKTATAANFAALAKQYGSDGTRDVGGDLGVFPPSQMVAEFAAGVAALKPGEIGLVKTDFGYHIVRRSTYQEVKAQFDPQYKQVMAQSAQGEYLDALTKAKKLEVKPNAAKVTKEVAADLDGHKGDRTAIGSSTIGNFTAGDLARWIGSMQQREQMRGQIQGAPDSVLPNFVKSLMLNEILLKQADSAGITVDTAEMNAARNAFKSIVRATWTGLHISPELLADSAKTPAEKERLAAARVDSYLTRLLNNQEGYIDVPPPLADALHEKYDGSIKPAGVARALELAQKTRAHSDSAKAAAQPKSAVPMPDTGAKKK